MTRLLFLVDNTTLGDTFINIASDDNSPLVVYISHTANYDGDAEIETSLCVT